MPYVPVHKNDFVLIHVQPKNQAQNEAGEACLKPETFEPFLDYTAPLSIVKKVSVNHVPNDPPNLPANIQHAKNLISGCRKVRPTHKFAIGGVAEIRQSGKAFGRSVLVTHSPIYEQQCKNPGHCDIVGVSHDFAHWHALAYVFQYA